MKSHPSKLDLTKPVRTRDGRPVRIICTDRKGAYPVLYLVENSQGSETAVPCFSSGLAYLGTEGANDLVNVPETVRVCFYKYMGDIACVTVNHLDGYWTEEKCRAQWPDAIFKDIELS